jgi:hypothetical protein
VTPFVFAALIALAPAQTDPQGPAAAAPPEVAAPPGVVPPFEMPEPETPAPAPAYTAPAKVPTAPVTVEAWRGALEGPKPPAQQLYEQGVRGAFAAEQALQGPLDGQWTVSAADGGPALWSLLLNDAGGADQPVEGAWRDLRKGSGPDAAGVLDTVERDGAGLTVRFHAPAAGPGLTLRLKPEGPGRWTGALERDGRRTPVVMTRG